MLIQDLAPAEFEGALGAEGLHVEVGAWTVHLRTSVADLVRDIAEMYGAYPVERRAISDVQLTVAYRRTWRSRFRRSVMTAVDGQPVFGPVRPEAAYAAFESTFNWSIALAEVAPLLMHGAVLERHGKALLMPAPSGSGKSTLCAALACSGWRLFSDEAAIFEFGDSYILPCPRPVSIKNRAVDLIRERFPEAHFGRLIRGTPKGDVAYMRAPSPAVVRAHEGARPGLVVRPRYEAGSALSVRFLSKPDAFRLLTQNAVNYASMLRHGFDTLAAIVEQCVAVELTYSDLDAAIGAICDLHHDALKR